MIGYFSLPLRELSILRLIALAGVQSAWVDRSEDLTMSRLIVQAKVSRATQQHDIPTRTFVVHPGDFGVVRWVAHKTDTNYVQPLIIWDLDPRKLLSEIDPREIAIVGTDFDGDRILFSECRF